MYSAKDGKCFASENPISVYVAFDDSARVFNVTAGVNPNVSQTNDIVVGVWTRFLNFIPKTMVWSGNHVLFKVYTNSASEKIAGSASMAAYLNSAGSYIFEVLINGKVLKGTLTPPSNQIENTWNLVVLSYNKDTNVVTAYVRSEKENILSTNISTSGSIDTVNSVITAYFCQDPQTRTLGFNGMFASPAVLYGKKIAKNLLLIWDSFLPFTNYHPNAIPNFFPLNNLPLSIDDHENYPSKFYSDFFEARSHAVAGWFKYRRISPNHADSTQEHVLLALDLDSNFSSNTLAISFIPNNQSFKLSYSPVLSNSQVSAIIAPPAGFNFRNVEKQWIFVYMGYNEFANELTFVGSFANSSFNFVKIFSGVDLNTPFFYGPNIGGLKQLGNNGLLGAVYATSTPNNFSSISDFTQAFPNVEEIPKALQNITVLPGDNPLITKTQVTINDCEGVSEYGIYLWFNPAFGSQQELLLASIQVNDNNFLRDVMTVRLINNNNSFVITTYNIDATGEPKAQTKVVKITNAIFEGIGAYFYFGYKQETQQMYYFFYNGAEKTSGTITGLLHYTLPDQVVVTIFDTDRFIKKTINNDVILGVTNAIAYIGSGSYLDFGHLTIATWGPIGGTTDLSLNNVLVKPTA